MLTSDIPDSLMYSDSLEKQLMSRHINLVSFLYALSREEGVIKPIAARSSNREAASDHAECAS